MKLKKREISVLNIIPYSSKNSDIYSKNKIEEYLEKWNLNDVKCAIARNFQLLFDKFGDYFHEKIKKEKINLSTINSLLINIEQVEDAKKLELIKEGIRYKIDRSRESEKELKQLNMKFLSLLKKAAETVDIDIYESLIDDQKCDMLEFIKQYKKENNIKDKNYKSLINVRLYYVNNEVFRHSGLFSNNKNSMEYRQIINKKLNYINRRELLKDKKSIKNIIEDFSNLSFKFEGKQNSNSMLIKNKVKNLKIKDIEWLKIK